MKTEVVLVPAKKIAEFTGYEKQYADEASLINATDLTKAELVVPLVVNGVFLVEQAGVDPYGSNNGLPTEDCVLKMPTPSSRSLTAPHVPVDPTISTNQDG